MSESSLEGRTCVVTGASSGVGEQTALGLARRGACVVLVCRSRERGERSRAAIVRASGNPAVQLQLADLTSQAAINAEHARSLGLDNFKKNPIIFCLSEVILSIL